MRLSPFLFSLGVSVLFFPGLTAVNASEATTILTSEQEPDLPKLGSERKRATGRVTATIDGKKEEFMTTSERIEISEERIKAADPRAQETLRRMNGRVIETASLKAIGQAIYVTLDAYGNIGETGPETTGKKATSLKIAFALAPETLSLLDKQREVSYSAPGGGIGDQAVGKEIDLKLESITKLPGGALAFKGSFSGTLTKSMKGENLAKPVKVEGTFSIDRAGADKAVLSLIQSAVSK